MKPSLSSKSSATGLLFACALTALAADDDPNRFGLGFRMGFNLEARFKDSAHPANSAGPATGGGLDRLYDDGFVRRDASGDQGGSTWNWGYEHTSQIVGQNIEFHSSSASALAPSRENSDPALGAELTYERRLGKWSWASWGVLSAFNFTAVDIRESHSQTGDAVLLTDTYSLGAVVPPLAPYTGSFAGPGPVLNDTPLRNTHIIPGGAALSAHRKLDAELYGFRLGPYLEIPVVKRLAVELSGGLAVGVIDSEFEYRDRLAIAGATTGREGRNRSSDVLAGGFVEAQLAFPISSSVSVFTGAQFQYLPDFKQQAGSREAKLELGEGLFYTLGVKWQF